MPFMCMNLFNSYQFQPIIESSIDHKLVYSYPYIKNIFYLTTNCPFKKSQETLSFRYFSFSVVCGNECFPILGNECFPIFMQETTSFKLNSYNLTHADISNTFLFMLNNKFQTKQKVNSTRKIRAKGQINKLVEMLICHLVYQVHLYKLFRKKNMCQCQKLLIG